MNLDRATHEQKKNEKRKSFTKSLIGLNTTSRKSLDASSRTPGFKVSGYRLQICSVFEKTSSMCECRTLYVGAKCTCITTGTIFGICCVLGGVCFWFVGLCVVGPKTRKKKWREELVTRQADWPSDSRQALRYPISVSSPKEDFSAAKRVCWCRGDKCLYWPFPRITATRQKYRIRILWCHVPVRHIDICR